MNIDGANTLACTKYISDMAGEVRIYPLPHMDAVKDLVPDLTRIFAQYQSIEPWLKTETPPPERERLQTPEERAKDQPGWIKLNKAWPALNKHDYEMILQFTTDHPDDPRSEEYRRILEQMQ